MASALQKADVVTAIVAYHRVYDTLCVKAMQAVYDAADADAVAVAMVEYEKALQTLRDAEAVITAAKKTTIKN